MRAGGGACLAGGVEGRGNWRAGWVRGVKWRADGLLPRGFHGVSKRVELAGPSHIPQTMGSWLVPDSQDGKLQRLEEKTQEPITMGSWLRSWLPSHRFSRRFETRSGVPRGVRCKENGPVFTAS